MPKTLSEKLFDFAIAFADRESSKASSRSARQNVNVENLGKADSLRYAMTNNVKVEFDYRRKDGQEGTYFANPYSMRSNNGRRYLYATERKHGSSEIHSFIASRVNSVRVLPDRPFSPNWPTEPESV